MVENPSDELIIEALKIDPSIICEIENPSEYLCLFAVKTQPVSIEFIKNQTERICLEAIKNCYPQNASFLLKKIKNPTEIVCLEAIKLNIDCIFVMDNIPDCCIDYLKKAAELTKLPIIIKIYEEAYIKKNKLQAYT